VSAHKANISYTFIILDVKVAICIALTPAGRWCTVVYISEHVVQAGSCMRIENLLEPSIVLSSEWT
jgi:hypothetical protein